MLSLLYSTVLLYYICFCFVLSCTLLIGGNKEILLLLLLLSLVIFTYVLKPGRVAQSVTTDACLTADQGGSEFDPGPVRYFCED